MTQSLSPRLKAFTSLSANCFFEVNPKDWTEKVGMRDLKIINGSSTELFDCKIYLEARFWNFFTHKLSKTVAEGINRGIKGLKESQMAGLWLPRHAVLCFENPPKIRLPKLSILLPYV